MQPCHVASKHVAMLTINMWPITVDRHIITFIIVGISRWKAEQSLNGLYFNMGWKRRSCRCLCWSDTCYGTAACDYHSGRYWIPNLFNLNRTKSFLIRLIILFSKARLRLHSNALDILNCAFEFVEKLSLIWKF